MRKNRTLIGLMLLTMLLAALPLGLTRAEPEPAATSENPDWITPQQLSVSDQAEKLPVVAANPNNGNVLVAYSVRDAGTENTDDVVYRASNSYGNGGSWTSAQPIHVSPSEDSVQVDLALDGAGSAHAVWVEGAAAHLVYAPRSDWPTNNTSNLPTTISDVAISSNPDLVINGNTLDVVWSEGPPMNVYHARSTNGGATWTSRNLVHGSPASSFSPSLVVDPGNGNKLYVVWEETAGGIGSIYYSEGTVSGGSSSWTSAIEISELGEGSLGDSKDFRPKIVWQNGQRQVAYTHVSEVDPDFQTIYYTRCNNNCTSRSGWAVQQNISGQAVGANATDPFNVYSTMATLSGCTFVYFHGTDSDFSQDNEGIWGVNSCDGWAFATRDGVTDPKQTRSIYPVIVTHPESWLYLVYEQVVNEQRRVYFTRGEVEINRGVFLPVVMRN